MIDTACLSSLVAVHQAAQSLRLGESPLAIAVGASLLLGPAQYVAESKLRMLSPDRKSGMWDEAADGCARLIHILRQVSQCKIQLLKSH